MAKPRAAPTTLSELEAQEEALVLPRFTAEDAWGLGCLLRGRLVSSYPTTPCVIHISLSTPPTPHPLFHAVSLPGTTPDNDVWIARKTRTVLRFHRSSYYMHVKLSGDERLFAEKYSLVGERAGEYAIHGGGVPVRVKGVEGVVGIVVVSGLKQEEDHMVVVEGMEEFKRGLEE